MRGTVRSLVHDLAAIGCLAVVLVSVFEYFDYQASLVVVHEGSMIARDEGAILALTNPQVDDLKLEDLQSSGRLLSPKRDTKARALKLNGPRCRGGSNPILQIRLRSGPLSGQVVWVASSEAQCESAVVP